MNRYKDWMEEAVIDLGKAKVDQEHGYYNWACFTAQQAAEKAVKGLSMRLGFDVWGHSITMIFKALQDAIHIPPPLVEYGQVLDSYYIPTRYPNGFSVGKPSDYYNSKMAQEALHACEEVIRFCKAHCD